MHSNVPDGQTSYEQGGWQEYYFEPMVEYFSKRADIGKSAKAARTPKHKRATTKAKSNYVATSAKKKVAKKKSNRPAAKSKKKSTRSLRR